MKQCIENKGCSSSLEVDNDDKCGLLNDHPWKTITINDNQCNEITGELVIQNNLVLESITIGKNSFTNVPQLNLTNLPKLNSFSVGENSFASANRVVIDSNFIKNS